MYGYVIRTSQKEKKTPTAFIDFTKAFEHVDRMKLTELRVIKEQRVRQQMRVTQNVLPHIFFLGRKLLKIAVSSRIFHEMMILSKQLSYSSQCKPMVNIPSCLKNVYFDRNRIGYWKNCARS
jgi:hypothetical protein